MIQVSLVFDHHKRTRKGEEGPVEVRVTVNRKPYYINTGVRVTKDRLVGNCLKDVPMKCDDGEVRMTDDADRLNERLTTIVAMVEKEVNWCLVQKMSINVVEIRRKVFDLGSTSERPDDPNLIKWIREMTATMNIAKNTKMRYETLCRRLEAYGKMTRWEHLTAENIYAWDVWLRGQEVPLTANQREAGMEPSMVSDSAVYQYHKCLKAMLNKALKFEKIAANPYDRMKGAFKRGKRDVVDYLTEEQMQKVLDLTPVPGSQVAMARDLFIFQMYTGLGYADTQVFDLSQYQRTVEKVNGKEVERWVFTGQRVKTGVPYVSMLLPPVVEVLKRNGWRVPKMNNQRYNQMLKAIGMCIGIEKLHSHMGRHTFATWMLSEGARIENVSRMLGHTDITMTQRYAKALAKDVLDDYEKIERKMTSKQKKIQ